MGARLCLAMTTKVKLSMIEIIGAHTLISDIEATCVGTISQVSADAKLSYFIK